MKNTLLAVCCMLFSFGFSQEWTSEEKEILNRFGLESNDPRGIVFNREGSECSEETHSNIKSAIETFFTATIKKDLSSFCIEGKIDEQLVGEALDIHRIVQLYLKD